MKKKDSFGRTAYLGLNGDESLDASDGVLINDVQGNSGRELAIETIAVLSIGAEDAKV